MPTEGVSLEIRAAETRDVARIAEIYQASVSADGLPDEYDGDRHRAVFAGRVEEGGGTALWVATAEREDVIGFVALEEDWVTHLYVDPGHRRAGVGKALVGLVAGLCPDGFALRVYETNHQARRFYRHCGLVELEHTDGADHQRVPDLQMAWLGRDPLRTLRRRIDAVDDELAVVLARRFALAHAVQDHKVAAGVPSGEDGRDPGREAEIVGRMAARAPMLAPEHLARVMNAVVEAGIAAWRPRS